MSANRFCFVAKQPILDCHLEAYGYELLYRDSDSNVFPVHTSSFSATTSVLHDHFSQHKESLVGIDIAFINFDEESLLNGQVLLFSPSDIIIELLESIVFTDNVVETVKTLHEKGYRFALDDYSPSITDELIFPYISIIKMDIRAHGVDNTIALAKQVATLAPDIEFLAEKVECLTEFNETKKHGFRYFQGYFFAKPTIHKHCSLSPSELTMMQIIQELSREDFSFDRVERVIKLDVILSYRILRYVNASSDLVNPISSFKQALVYLGRDRLRTCFSMLSLSVNHKPLPLYEISLQRAYFMQFLFSSSHESEHSEAFMVGLFSALEAILDKPIEQVVGQLPLTARSTKALLEHEGALGHALKLSQCFDVGKLSDLSCLALDSNWDAKTISAAYMHSSKCARKIMRLLEMSSSVKRHVTRTA